MRVVVWTSTKWTIGTIFGCACAAAVLLGGATVHGQVTIKSQHIDAPLVLNQDTDFVLKDVYIKGLKDAAALTLAGKIASVNIQNCHFGEVTAGANGHAAALEASGAAVGSFTATDSAFYDAENQLVSFKEGSFGTVTFLHCIFKASDSFLKNVYAQSPWRTCPPVTEFYNIDRLELLDNQYTNTVIVIHPSVKMVIFRGDISNIQVESPNTQVIRLDVDTVPASGRADAGSAGTDITTPVAVVLAHEPQKPATAMSVRPIEPAHEALAASILSSGNFREAANFLLRPHLTPLRTN